MTRVLHVTEYCHLRSAGGTERYILDLTEALQRRGIGSTIGWLAGPEEPKPADDTVHPLPGPSLRTDPAPPELRAAARDLLLDRAPDVLHFHGFGRGEALVAEVAGELGIPYVFTYHSPAWTCRRDDLLRWGSEVCDGRVFAARCAACMFNKRFGTPRLLAWAAARAWPAIGAAVSTLYHKRNRRLALSSDLASYRVELTRFLARSSTVVVCSDWAVPVMCANGAQPARVVTLPQGVSATFLARAHQRTSTSGDTFVIGYVGRWTVLKGIHVLVGGFRRLRDPRARLRIFGATDDPLETALTRFVTRAARADPRIEVRPTFDLEQALDTYSQLDLLAVPSVSLETGPLVLFEALALGLPVYGSASVGHQQLLERHGTLVEPNTPAAWHRALEQACACHGGGHWPAMRARAASAPVATMDSVAERMLQLYARAIAGDHQPRHEPTRSGRSREPATADASR